MSKRHPNNGPTFSDSTIKKPRPVTPSPGRIAADMDEKAREAATYRRMHKLLATDPAAAVAEWEKKKS
jgi:hypothetical protein